VSAGKSKVHEKFMALAIEEAKNGIGFTHPNPAVGCVIVKNGKVIAHGFHSKAGAPHAEAVALKEAGTKANGATLYSTLEPCNHFGKTPPCTAGILAAGIETVVYASDDPNPLVNGLGKKKLESSKIKVISGVLKNEADSINRPFFKFMKTGLPFVSLKMAISLDGKIATQNGESKWITNELSRQAVHQWRSEIDAIVVGSGTIRKDNPSLTSRVENGKNPMRIVVDATLSNSLSSKVFSDGQSRTIVATGKSISQVKRAQFENAGIDVWPLASKDSQVNLLSLLKQLAKNGFLHVGCEGGATLANSLLKKNLVDELILFVAPKVLGGDGMTWSGNSFGIRSPKNAKLFQLSSVERFGDDVCLRLLKP
jgi:diaminohydroxyphosphoribosylaminopyrimidine deaminase / 5-amino-6-(5-phosphoribosylamino)uracil reductase